jgi:hypothetical protein
MALTKEDMIKDLAVLGIEHALKTKKDLSKFYRTEIQKILQPYQRQINHLKEHNFFEKDYTVFVHCLDADERYSLHPLNTRVYGRELYQKVKQGYVLTVNNSKVKITSDGLKFKTFGGKEGKIIPYPLILTNYPVIYFLSYDP